MAYKLPLDDIINITVNLSPVPVTRAGFDSILVLGNSSVITTEDRVHEFFNTDDMLTYGFTATSEEYLAAVLYFAQTPSPSHIFIGVFDSDNETVVEAVTACRQASGDWYGLVLSHAVVGSITDEDISSVATYVEGMKPFGVMGINPYNTTDVPSRYDTIAQKLKNEGYRRTFTQFCSTDDIVKSVPSGILGYAMGSATPTSRAFDLCYKPIAGMSAENTLDQTTLNTILNTYNSNVYINQGDRNIFRQGNMCDGTPFDEIFFLDQLVADVQNEIMNTLTSSSKVPQTEAGVNELLTAINAAINPYLTREFISPGVWNGKPILDLNTGDMLAKGYRVQFAELSAQSATDRAQRKAPMCYISLKLAGSIRYITIGIDVDR